MLLNAWGPLFFIFIEATHVVERYPPVLSEWRGA